MSLEPLLASPWHIQLHVAAATAAFVIGVIQFAAPKGTLPHRVIGPIWAALMTVVVLTAIFIVRPRAPGEPFTAHFSLIHYIFIPLTTWGLVGGVRHVLGGGPDLRRHGGAFLSIFVGGILVAGAFAFLPGRIMHDVVFDKRLSGNPEAYGDPYLYFLPGAKPPSRDDDGAGATDAADEDEARAE